MQVMDEVETILGRPRPELRPDLSRRGPGVVHQQRRRRSGDRQRHRRQRGRQAVPLEPGHNTFTQVVTLTAGLGEAYTPTIIGADGTVYAINNATMFAVGRSATTALHHDTDRQRAESIDSLAVG